MSAEPNQAPVKHRKNQARRTDGHHVGSDWQRLISLMVEDGLPWDMAAKTLNIPLQSARNAMARPSVLKHLRRRRQEHLQVICTKNIARLDQLADQRENITGAVKAIQVLEQMQADAAQPTTRQTSPGIVINVISPNKQVTVAPAPAVIEHQDSDQE